MSTLKVTNIQDSSGSNASTTEQINQGRAKVWCRWNGDGTAAINDSFNVSSLTDNGTGDFTVNFSTNMSNANYSVGWIGGGGLIWNGDGTYATTSSFRSLGMGRQDSYGLHDGSIWCVNIFGDQ